jgi:hypothetical protein
MKSFVDIYYESNEIKSLAGAFKATIAALIIDS